MLSLGAKLSSLSPGPLVIIGTEKKRPFRLRPNNDKRPWGRGCKLVRVLAIQSVTVFVGNVLEVTVLDFASWSKISPVF